MRRGAGSGSRRSSLGMRGRRASSLIDTGKSNGLSPLPWMQGFLADAKQHYRMMKLIRQISTSISRVKA